MFCNGVCVDASSGHETEKVRHTLDCRKSSISVQVFTLTKCLLKVKLCCTAGSGGVHQASRFTSEDTVYCGVFWIPWPYSVLCCGGSDSI